MWNPWRENLKDTPKESLNWRLWYGVFGTLYPNSSLFLSGDALRRIRDVPPHQKNRLLHIFPMANTAQYLG